MSSTQIKPKTSGSFTTITVTSTNITSDSSTGMPGATPSGLQHAALRAVNEWHNTPANTTNTARAQKIASAAGITIQEV